jgi:hypothetical protein
MKSVLGPAILAAAISMAAASPTAPASCPFNLDQSVRVTERGGASQTARGNERCIWVDAAGTAHLVWEDNWNGHFQIYYTSVTADSVAPDIRLTNSAGESNFPCITGLGDSIYILWQETISKTPQIMYCRLDRGKEAARVQLTSGELPSSCPVAALGPDGTLNIAWFRGSGNFSSVYYGRVLGDSLVGQTNISTEHPGGSRPDVACDASGKILIAWYEGFDVKSRLWDGSTWQDEIKVATNNNRSWRLSVTSLGKGKWALAWFDQAPQSTDVRAAFFDGKAWSEPVRVNAGRTGFYPAAACFGPGNLIVTWEDQDLEKEQYLLMMRCWDGQTWGAPAEVVRGRVMSRYASLCPWDDRIYAIWFSPVAGNNEIYFGLLGGK